MSATLGSFIDWLPHPLKDIYRWFSDLFDRFFTNSPNSPNSPNSSNSPNSPNSSNSPNSPKSPNSSK
jgi:hypothetical protein